jgi:hypothetical protein
MKDTNKSAGREMAAKFEYKRPQNRTEQKSGYLDFDTIIHDDMNSGSIL